MQHCYQVLQHHGKAPDSITVTCPACLKLLYCLPHRLLLTPALASTRHSSRWFVHVALDVSRLQAPTCSACAQQAASPATTASPAPHPSPAPAAAAGVASRATACRTSSPASVSGRQTLIPNSGCLCLCRSTAVLQMHVWHESEREDAAVFAAGPATDHWSQGFFISTPLG
jgi:hypothetical protein